MKTEWKDKYVSYQRLKAMIKALSETRADKKVHDAVLGKSVPKGGWFCWKGGREGSWWNRIG